VTGGTIIDPISFLVVWILFLIVVLTAIGLVAAFATKSRRKVTAYVTRSEIDEFDLRLPYKRFKELYPWSNITYEEYKKMQAQRAFRKARSSSENKRMVR